MLNAIPITHGNTFFFLLYGRRFRNLGFSESGILLMDFYFNAQFHEDRPPKA
jgi:hypothetical protein